MNKIEFLSIIANELKDIPEKELSDIIFDYQEYFTVAFQNGKTEEEIIQDLGDPYEIAYKYINNNIPKIENIKENPTFEYIEDYTDPYSYENYEAIDYKDRFTKEDTTFKEKDNYNKQNNLDRKNRNTVLKILILIILIILLGPAAFGIFISLFFAFLSILAGTIALDISVISLILIKLGLVVIGGNITPPFISEFPMSVIIFLVIGVILFSIFLAMLSYYFFKWFIFLCIDLLKKFFKEEK